MGEFIKTQFAGSTLWVATNSGPLGQAGIQSGRQAGGSQLHTDQAACGKASPLTMEGKKLVCRKGSSRERAVCAVVG